MSFLVQKMRMGKKRYMLRMAFTLIILPVPVLANTATFTTQVQNKIDKLLKLNTEEHSTIRLNRINQFNDGQNQRIVAHSSLNHLSLNEAMTIAINYHPRVKQSIAEIESQIGYIDATKAGYYPQISAGFSSQDLLQSKNNTQLVRLNLSQTLYDFGKIRKNINLQEAKLLKEQANLLLAIEEIGKEVIDHIIAIKRYTALAEISENKIRGIERLLEITKLRASAGISSQADPVQAQSYLEASKAELIVQQTQLRLAQRRLNTLLGFDTNQMSWILPSSLLKNANLFASDHINSHPKLIIENIEIEMTKLQQQAKKLENYPTLQLRGELSQAINGRHPNTLKNNDTDTALLLEATHYLYQGGANKAEQRALEFRIESAQARLNEVYRELEDDQALAKQQIIQKQKQMDLASMRANTNARTKELYEEQYKLGTRTAVDLLNAELAIHSVAQEIENLRYDIYQQIAIYIEAHANTVMAYELNLNDIQGVSIQP